MLEILQTLFFGHGAVHPTRQKLHHRHNMESVGAWDSWNSSRRIGLTWMWRRVILTALARWVMSVRLPGHLEDNTLSLSTSRRQLEHFFSFCAHRARLTLLHCKLQRIIYIKLTYWKWKTCSVQCPGMCSIMLERVTDDNHFKSLRQHTIQVFYVSYLRNGAKTQRDKHIGRGAIHHNKTNKRSLTSDTACLPR